MNNSLFFKFFGFCFFQKVTQKKKKVRNYMEIREFILLGLSDDPQVQVVIFVFLLITYMLSITGNLTIITLTLLDIYLQTPIYFFLRIFSILEVSFTTVTIPKFLATIITGDKTISFNNCMTQLFFFIFLGVTEFYLLVAMSYDRYIAICKPLHYMTIMNHRVCTLFVLASWLTSFLIIFPLLMFCIQLDYCKSNVINHFSCDYFPLLYLSCSDTKFLEILGFSCAVFCSVVHFSINNSVLHICHQNNFEDPFYHSEDKGLFHVFVPHDCHLHLLWQLHFHVCESICKRQGLFEQGSGCAKYLSSTHAEPLCLHS